MSNNTTLTFLNQHAQPLLGTTWPSTPVTDDEHVAFLSHWLNVVVFCS